MLRLSLLAGFVLTGLWGVADFLLHSASIPKGPDASLDDLAHRLFLIDGGAAKIRAQVATLPSNQAILVAGPGEDWTLTEATYLISYLAWPRPVYSVGIRADGKPSPFAAPPPPDTRLAGYFFYVIESNQDARNTVLSSRLTFTREESRQ